MKRSIGEKAACKCCGQDIEWQGRFWGWRDRGGNRGCVAYFDREGEAVTPSKGAKHRPPRDQ